MHPLNETKAFSAAHQIFLLLLQLLEFILDGAQLGVSLKKAERAAEHFKQFHHQSLGSRGFFFFFFHFSTVLKVLPEL